MAKKPNTEKSVKLTGWEGETAMFALSFLRANLETLQYEDEPGVADVTVEDIVRIQKKIAKIRGKR